MCGARVPVMGACEPVALVGAGVAAAGAGEVTW